METTKYKQSVGDYIKKIDVKTGSVMAEFNVKQVDRYKGLIDEMNEWAARGNEIEPFETVAEINAREEQEAINALESQKQTCIHLLNESEIHVSNDPPYPNDVQSWKDARKQWRTILKSDKIQSIPAKPFS